MELVFTSYVNSLNRALTPRLREVDEYCRGRLYHHHRVPVGVFLQSCHTVKPPATCPAIVNDGLGQVISEYAKITENFMAVRR